MKWIRGSRLEATSPTESPPGTQTTVGLADRETNPTPTREHCSAYGQVWVTEVCLMGAYDVASFAGVLCARIDYRALC